MRKFPAKNRIRAHGPVASACLSVTGFERSPRLVLLEILAHFSVTEIARLRTNSYVLCVATYNDSTNVVASHTSTPYFSAVHAHFRGSQRLQNHSALPSLKE